MERNDRDAADRVRRLPGKSTASAGPSRFRGAPNRSRGFSWSQRGGPPLSGNRPIASGSNLQPLGRPAVHLPAMTASYMSRGRGRGRGRSMTTSNPVNRSSLPSKMSIHPAPWTADRGRGRGRGHGRGISSNVTPLGRGGLRLPSKTSVYNPHNQGTGMRRQRDSEDLGARSIPRMMVPTMSIQGENNNQQPSGPRRIGATRKEGFYVVNGKLHPLRAPVDENDDVASVNRHSAPSKTTTHNQTIGSRRTLQIAAKSVTRRAAQRSHNPDTRGNTDVIEITDTEPDTRNADDVSHLLSALGALNINERQMQAHSRLPFLKRNIRKGFLARCRLLDLPTTLTPPSSPVHVTYRYLHEEDDSDDTDDSSSLSSIGQYETKITSMTKWLCPLCTMFGELPTREVLQFHLEQYHNEVDIDWSESNREPGVWRVYLTIPPPGAEDGAVPDFDSDDESEPEPESEPDVHEITVISDSDDSDAVVEVAPPPKPTRIEEETTLDVIPPPPTSPPRVRPPARPTREIKHKLRPPSPPLFPIIPQPRPEVVKPPSYRGSLPSRYPSPPPPTNPHGPAAQYPYLHVIEKEEGAIYSCRPDGPRIYDLLNTLPLKPFGILSWMIVDREEEIYELEDINDEDKSMMALWNRWIMLNRLKFVSKGYLQGVKDFLDVYWHMIHLAAGWGALRAFLLMLMTDRFLTVSEVAQALRYYENKTGMDFWYKDNVEEAEPE